MSAERVQTLAPLTVGGVDVTVSSSGADQDGSSTLRTLHEGQVSDGAVVHAELQVWAWPQRDINTHEIGSEVPIGPRPQVSTVCTCGVARLRIEREDFDIFVIGAGGQQLPTVAPGHAVDGAFVVFVPLEAHHRLLRGTGTTEERTREEEARKDR